MRTFFNQKLFGFAIILSLLFASLHPALVLADGETPVVEKTEESIPSTEATEDIQATEIIGESEEKSPTDEGPANPAETTEPAGSTDSVVEETPTPEGTERINGDVENTPTSGMMETGEDDNPTEEPSPTATPDPGKEISDILEAAADANLKLVDENGDPLIMASEQASEAIGSSGDPSGILGVARDGASVGDAFMYYRATGSAGQQDGDCSYSSGTSTLTCYFANVLSQAVSDAADSSEIIIEADTYNETVSVDKTLILTGVSGSVYVDKIILLAGASVSGSTNIFASTVEVNAGAIIQDGIDLAVSGGTVNISGDSFEEDIEITKDLTLQGTSGTVIKSPDSINVEFSTGSGGKSPVVYVNNAMVNIRNIEVDGNGNVNNNTGFVGVAYYNASGEVSDCLIANIIDTPLSGSQRGVALYVYNQDGVDRTINIFNNEFTNFQKNAMALSGSGLTVDVHDNYIQGSGQVTEIAQNGIQVSYDATGSITNNTIEDIWYTGPTDYGASGILIYSAGGTVDVSNNTVRSSEMSIYVQDSLANIVDNTIEDGEFGLIIYSPSNGSQVTGNTFTNNTQGFYTDDGSVILRENIFVGNGFGAEFDLASGSGDAIYNYWGCDEGPEGSSANCNPQSGADFTPWLLDEDGDFVFTSSDGSGGYVDNCPTVANPDQADSDGDGIGDACDPSPTPPPTQTPTSTFTPTGIPTSTPAPAEPTTEPPVPGPAQPVDAVIPVTGGDVTRLACPDGSNQVVFELENGNQVRFIGLCDLDALVDDMGESSLPHSLPDGTSYVSDLLIQVLDEGTLLEILSGGSVEMNFLVPSDVELGNLVLYYWDEDTENWLEIEMDSADAVYPIKLSDDSSNDGRLIYAGLSSIINRASSTENFTGLFVLVTK